MTTRTASKSAKPARMPKKLVVDAESQALMANPLFRAMLDEAERTPPEALLSLEELDQRLGPVTAEDDAIADEYLAVLDRLEEEQGGEVTDDQARLFKAVLIAARYLRDGRTLDAWVEYTGVPAADLRATAVALRAVGLANAHAAATR